MKLSIKDRLIITSQLFPNMPMKGGYVEMIQLDDLKKQIQIDIDEAKKYNFRDAENGSVLWDILPDSDKEITLTPQQLDFLQLAIYALDEQKSIDLDILPTCKIIMEYKNK